MAIADSVRGLAVTRGELIFAAGFAGCLFGLLLASQSGAATLLPKLMSGLGVTVFISVSAALISMVLALIAGLAKLSSWLLVRWTAVTYSELFRGSSLLVQLFWLFYVLPHFGILLEPITVGIIGIALNYGAYGSEIVRGAIQATPRAQWDAVTALNMPYATAMRRIILPQAVLIMLPSYATLMVQLLKSTSLVSLITISDFTFEAYQLDQVTGDTIRIFTIVMFGYFALSLSISIIFRGLERWFSFGLMRGPA